MPDGVLTMLLSAEVIDLVCDSVPFLISGRKTRLCWLNSCACKARVPPLMAPNGAPAIETIPIATTTNTVVHTNNLCPDRFR